MLEMMPDWVIGLAIALVALLALLITIAPLAIWIHTAKTARLLKEQNELLRRIADGRPIGHPR